ncbi:magnesium/cobalt transporter CorA [Desulfosoma caldarium]|uniref:Magnesium transport protein CorA n=1 Tax=Desulfosoma caldarium TaxID=610254 RepID=A0A3N1US37_9BACT|nr:magnesium/cobalt transporter CorA [Desulfosoma caldarium]ROQ92189.1 magnesium transporter [Desulfosoma caldarium]
MRKSIGLKRRNRPSQSVKTTLPPGSPVFIGEKRVEKIRIDIIDYNENSIKECRDADLKECERLAKGQTVTWINVIGIHDPGIIEGIGSIFNLHPLTIEDIVNTNQRPKMEEFPDYLFIVLKMSTYNDETNNLEMEHVSLILGDNFVISFQEEEGDVFEPVRQRLRSSKGRIRKLKSDYLAYALMDAVVDHYFVAVERMGDWIEEVDDRIVAEPKQEDIQEIHRLKKNILILRKAVWPLREEIGSLEKSASHLIHPETRLFLRDLYDHTIQVIDITETFRDLVGGMHDTYLSGISNRMNEIMKVLTIFSTIFIPLTFIAGVYGTNFDNIPELHFKYGYFAMLGLMLIVALLMLRFFKRRGWI